MSEGFSSAAWSGTTEHSLCAMCWLLGLQVFFLPQSWYAWSLHIYSLSNLKLDQLTSRATSSLGQGIKRVEGPC